MPSRKRRREDDELGAGPAKRARPAEPTRSPSGVPLRFTHTPDHADYTQPKEQVKYGPGEGLTADDQRRAHALIHPGTPVPEQNSPEMKATPVFARLSQYNAKHATYLDHAHRTRRPLTIEEDQARTSGRNVTGASINHVIASGVGQNTLNQGLANFSRGRDAMPTGPVPAPTPTPQDGTEPAPDPAVEAHRARVRSSLASQAAAVGRVQMYNRAIAFENLAPEQKQASLARGSRPPQPTTAPIPGATDDGAGDVAMAEAGPVPAADHDVERNSLLARTVGVMERGGLAGYKGLLRDTFDSPANLRVGHGGVNGVVSTGLDVELDHEGRPSERSERLQAAHLAAAPDHDTQIWTTFTRSDEALSSSRAVNDSPAPAPRRTVRARKPPAKKS